MPFLAVGVEHTTAPLAVRERVALEAEDSERAIGSLRLDPEIDEIAVLSTCNRTEVYLFVGGEERGSQAVTNAAAAATSYLTGGDGELAQYVRTWEDLEAVEHLFRVASGLESQVLGEPQVLSQVREALETGQRLGGIGTNLHTLFRSAISCARQARAGTALGRVSVSIGSEAVAAAERALGSLNGRSVLLIGGGEMIRLAAEELRGKNLKAIYLANRTAATATELARLVGGTPATLADVPRLLPVVDAVIAATGARHYVVTPEDFQEVGQPRGIPLVIFDLAIPRDVDPAVGELPGVELHDLDSLLPAGITAHWDEDVRAMESVIAAEIQEFLAWYLTRRVVPVIANLRSHVEAVQQQELKRVSAQLAGLTDRERKAVESLTQRLIDKMFHHLVMRLRLAAQTDPRLVDAAEFFFLHGEGGLFPHAGERQDGEVVPDPAVRPAGIERAPGEQSS